MERTTGIFAALLLCIFVIVAFMVPATTPTERAGAGIVGAEVAATGCSDTLLVTAGDTLRRIAETCNTSVAALLAANPEITDPDTIYVGQLLQIPQGIPSGDAIPPAAVSPAPVVTFRPTAGAAGTVVEVVLQNFPPSSDVTVTFGTDALGTEGQVLLTFPARVDASGAGEVQFVVPPVAPRNEGYVIRALVANDVQSPPIEGSTVFTVIP